MIMVCGKPPTSNSRVLIIKSNIEQLTRLNGQTIQLN